MSVIRNAAKRAPTAVAMMNMGGPSTLPEVEGFLTNLFTDPEIIPMGPVQSVVGPYIAKRRTPKITEQYAQIGGGSPIKMWSNLQGEEMCKLLDEIRPETAPHKHYLFFRYANPLTEVSLKQMKEDGVTRAIAFSQYPQWSCTTTGSSMNQLWRELDRLNMANDFQWSLIDRWNTHPGYIKAVANRVRQGMEQFAPEDRDKVIIMFSAHSIPMKTVYKGDPYVKEIASTSELVMKELGLKNSHILSWQSKVGYLPWMGPSTSLTIEGFGKQGHKHVLAVPIAFTSDHVETLFEIDIEYAEEAHEAGITHFKRCPSLNDEPLLFKAMADIVKTHLDTETLHSDQYPLNCPGCVNPMCRSMRNPIKPYNKLLNNTKGVLPIIASSYRCCDATMDGAMETLKYALLGVNALLLMALIVTLATARSNARVSDTDAATPTRTAPKQALLVTAHPDDESMFFLPLVHSLTSPPAQGEPEWETHLLCLSRGNFGGLGAIRDQEMHACGQFLGVDDSKISVLDDPKLQDGMQAQWSREYVAQLVLQYMDKHSIDAVFTFDDYGVSGHPNHIDVHFGVRSAIQEQHKRCAAVNEAGASSDASVLKPVRGWALESVNIIRKYIGALDALVLPSMLGGHRESVFVFLFRPWWNYRAMALHHSQFVWYRRLFVIFSRYTFINTFKPLVQMPVGATTAGAEKKTQ